ncbi:MAG: DUF3817 domain-containing protein [Nocardioidaceae bacterium]
MKAALTPYRVMATIVGVLLIILCLIGLPLHYLSPDGSQAESVGDGISQYLGVAHGWLYMIFLVTAFVLSRKASWDLRFTIVTLVSGTIPILSFWAEHRATQDVKSKLAAEAGSGGAPAVGQSGGERSAAGPGGEDGPTVDGSGSGATKERSRLGGPSSPQGPGGTQPPPSTPSA